MQKGKKTYKFFEVGPRKVKLSYYCGWIHRAHFLEECLIIRMEDWVSLSFYFFVHMCLHFKVLPALQLRFSFLHGIRVVPVTEARSDLENVSKFCE